MHVKPYFAVMKPDGTIKAKKIKLAAEAPVDYELLGIVSTAPEYKLAWHLNNLGEFHLMKIDDGQIEFVNGEVYKFAILGETTDYYEVSLIKNRLLFPRNGYLLSEAQHFDYLLKLKHEVNEEWTSTFIDKAKKISVISYLTPIDPNELKFKDNLLF